jgi:hypothetical protein
VVLIATAIALLQLLRGSTTAQRTDGEDEGERIRGAILGASRVGSEGRRYVVVWAAI